MKDLITSILDYFLFSIFLLIIFLYLYLKTRLDIKILFLGKLINESK